MGGRREAVLLVHHPRLSNFRKLNLGMLIALALLAAAWLGLVYVIERLMD